MNGFPWHVEMPVPLFLAIVMGLLYLLRVSRQHATTVATKQVWKSRRELRRALSIVNKLEEVIVASRKNLANHRSNLVQFKERVGRLYNKKRRKTGRSEFCREVEELLNPTLRLVGQVADTSAQICHQSTLLMTFTEARIDSMTGVNNRAGLDHALSAQLAEMTRYGTKFSLALLDIDGFKQVNDRQGHLEGDRILQDVAKTIDKNVRDVDIVARYGGDEFVVVMPKADLEAALVVGERLRAKIQQKMLVTVSTGVASAIDGDTAEALLGRVDDAMYNAKRAGSNRVLCHNGETTETASQNTDSSSTNLEDKTLCTARLSDTTHPGNQATDEGKSERLQVAVAGPIDPCEQAAEGADG